MTDFVKPRKCRRCSGTGFVDARPNGGRCYSCDGIGAIESDATAIAAKAARDAGRKALGKAAFAYSTDAHVGLNKLEADAPERLTKAIASFLAGDARVLPALEAYGRE